MILGKISGILRKEGYLLSWLLNLNGIRQKLEQIKERTMASNAILQQAILVNVCVSSYLHQDEAR